jgi:hypothetical protein
MPRRYRCVICETVDQIALIELDTLMGDPAAWPASVWGQFRPPAGNLPASYRRFGAIEMGMAWLEKHGFSVSRFDVRRHYRVDVPKIAIDPDNLVATGLIARGNTHVSVETIDPLAYLQYYNTGIAVGVTGLKLIRDRIALLQETGAEVPIALIKMAVEAGKALAMSQATIRASGRPWGDEGDADEGFRAGSAPEASVRMGSIRIRTIEGEARPVVDKGPADRAAYSERAAQEGGEGLPHP